MREYYNFLEKERLETQLTDRNLCRVELNSRSLEATSLPADNKPNSIQAISKYESEYSNGIMHTYLTNRDPKNEAHLWLDADWIFPSVFPPPTPPTPKASIWRRAVRSVKKAPAKIKTFLGALNRFRCR